MNSTELAPDEAADPVGCEDWCDKGQQAQLMVLLTLKESRTAVYFCGGNGKRLLEHTQGTVCNDGVGKVEASGFKLPSSKSDCIEWGLQELRVQEHCYEELLEESYFPPIAAVRMLVIFRLPQS